MRSWCGGIRTCLARWKPEPRSEVLKNWEAIKRQERAAKAGTADCVEAEHKPLLDSVKSAMPALMEGMKLSKKAAACGLRLAVD